MIATGDAIDHVLETEGTLFLIEQDENCTLIAIEKNAIIVENEMIEVKDEIDAIEETLKWKDLALRDEMTAEVPTVIFVMNFL